MLQELMNVENGYFWVLLGLGLLALEALGVPGFFLGTLGVSAILTSVAAFFSPLPIVWLLVIFGVAAVGLFIFARPLVTRFLMGNLEHRSNVDGMVGRVVVVTQAIGGRNQAGYVKLAGDEWRALPTDGRPVEAGAEVTIERVEGATVFVGVPDESRTEEVEP
jgi:membrane protein implicated in regulation of membrane protease activity